MMAIDFFEQVNEHIIKLNETERKLFDYVVKNMQTVKDMSIQKFAEEQFLSTTSIFRFTQKLGFAGYSDFVNSLLVTTHAHGQPNLTGINSDQNYSKNYLDNAVETVRVMSQKQIDIVVELLQKKPRIYIVTDDHTHTIGQYVERLFIGLGFHAYFPETAYQRQNLVNRVREQDLIIAMSYSGKDDELVDFIGRIFLTERPHLLSITRADNNPLQMLSDTNFYAFADSIKTNSMHLTSSVTMLMVVEMLVYEYMNKNSKNDD